MKLYTENYPAPNPRKVHIYLAEKGLTVDRVHTKMAERQHKAPDFLKKNPLGQVPFLVPDRHHDRDGHGSGRAARRVERRRGGGDAWRIGSNAHDAGHGTAPGAVRRAGGGTRDCGLSERGVLQHLGDQRRDR